MGHWFRSANSANQINGNSLLSSTIHAVLTTLLAFYIVFIDEKAKGLIFIKIQSIITIVQNNDYCGLFQEYGQYDKILNNFDGLKFKTYSEKVIQNFVRLAILLEQTTMIVIFALSNSESWKLKKTLRKATPNDPFDHSKKIKFVQSMSLGYFLSDFAVLVHTRELGGTNQLLFHHSSAVCAYLFGMVSWKSLKLAFY